MPRKRNFTEPELERLAAKLETLWAVGTPIRSWLRRHASMLQAMVQDECSWDVIARAMTRAGILFATGKPWTARYLTIELAKATAPLKGYPSRRTSNSGKQKIPSDGPYLAGVVGTTIEQTPIQTGEITSDNVSLPGLHRVRVPVSKKSYEPPPALSEEEQAQRDILIAQARRAMRGES